MTYHNVKYICDIEMYLIAVDSEISYSKYLAIMETPIQRHKHETNVNDLQQCAQHVSFRT